MTIYFKIQVNLQFSQNIALAQNHPNFASWGVLESSGPPLDEVHAHCTNAKKLNKALRWDNQI